jgi:hypothetical protein
MLVAEKQLDDLVDEFKAKVKALIPQLVKEKHAELWAEHEKLQFKMAEIELKLDEYIKKQEIIWEHEEKPE